MHASQSEFFTSFGISLNPSCMQSVARGATGKLYMYDQRRTARFESVLHASTYAPFPVASSQSYEQEISGREGTERRQNTIRKRKPNEPKACRWKSGGCPTVPRRRSNAVGQCHQVLLLCVVIAARRSTLLVVDAEVLCSVSPRKRVGQFFVGRVTAGGRRDGGRPRVLFWKGEVEHAVDWKGCSCFSLCAGVFFAPSWSCAVLRCFPRFPESKSHYHVQTSECGIPG